MDPGTPRTEANRYKISKLLEYVSEGRIRVPRFQRSLRWDSNDIAQLFDSIYQGFPVGTLLFWQRQAKEEEVRIGDVVIQASAYPDALWVVDGQQRIHALASTLLSLDDQGPQPDSMVFDLSSQRFIFLGRNHRLDRQLPLREAHDTQRVLRWMAEHDLSNEMQARALRLADQLRNYEVPAYIVQTDDEADLQQIFDRINTFGKKMTRAEVFHALSTSQNDEGPSLRWLHAEVDGFGFGTIIDTTLLYCILAVRGPDMTREFRSEFRDRPGERREAIQAARVALRKAVAFIRDEAQVPHAKLVPYQYLLVGVARFFALHPDPSDWERVLLRRWFWRSAACGPLSRKGTTGTLAVTTSAIAEGDAYSSVERLLKSVPEPAGDEQVQVQVGRFQINSAEARITACAMAALGPRDLSNGDPIDVNAALEIAGSGALPRLATGIGAEVSNAANQMADSDAPDHPADDTAFSNTAANRIFVSATQANIGVDGEKLIDALLQFREQADEQDMSEVFRSHALSGEAVEALRDSDPDKFLKLRHERPTETVRNFVDAQAEWSHPAHPGVRRLLEADLNG